ncbi:MAG: penicillin-binding protein activator [Smithella sp.]|jgi:ABC-type branched-subunit amino acid transport system substrate-binding protein
MNFYRNFEKTFVLLLIVFILCFMKTAIASENAAPGAPAEIKPQQVSLPPVISPSGKVGRNAIGCILPLSGKYADWGNKALDAIMLSAGKFNRQNKIPWEIIAEDSQDSPEKTKSAVANLANLKNVMAIIAVTETAEAMDVAREADKRKIPIIMITSKEGVTSAGEYVFQHFLTPTQQIRALAKYVIDDLNCAIFSVLYPQDEYGEEMFKVFRKEVTRIGGKVEKAIPYGINQTDFAGEINKLTDTVVKSPSKTRINKDDEQEVIPVDFEALFIPDSYMRVKMIASQLAFYNVKGFVLLGTSLWNSPNLLKNGSEYLDEAIFADSFFKEGPYPGTYNFVDSYYTVYKRYPESIEALSFDTAGMIFTTLENENVKTRQALVTGLKNIGIYNGATGSIYFDPDRVAQKTPFILRVKKGKIEQVK